MCVSRLISQSKKERGTHTTQREREKVGVKSKDFFSPNCLLK